MKNDNGFTLIELLIALFIGSITMASIYTVFMSQQRSYYVQDQVARMDQTLRGGLDFLTRDLMAAGYDDPNNSANASIVAINLGSIQFTADRNEDGDVNDTGENVVYSLYVAADGIQKLGRNDLTGALGNQAIAEYIEQIEFLYTMDDGTRTLAPAVLNDIRSVQISILARAAEVDDKFRSAVTYTSAFGTNWIYPADNIRRRLLTTSVKIRNMGL